MTDRPARTPFDAVLCDVDDVPRHYDPAGARALERAAGPAEGTTTKAAFREAADPERAPSPLFLPRPRSVLRTPL